MAEAIVSGVLKQLGSFAVQPIQEELKLVVCLNKGVEKLTSEFESIQAVLVDAEKRQVTEENVRVWLEKLKYVSYDVDLVLDQWRTANLQIDGEADQHADTFMSKVCSCFLFPYLVIRVRRVALAINLSFKITAINERLDDIAKTKDKYGFRITPTTGIIELPQLEETTSIFDPSEVFGRVEYKDDLEGKLLLESSKEKLCVISIIGMGGIGKSTLAKSVYNSENKKDFFDKRIWVFVSNPFNKLRIAKNILESLEGRPSDSSDQLQFYLEKISESLKKIKFLIVLDNVWTDNYNDWEPFHHCLKNGLHGSKVLVTTRNQSTADMMDSTYSIPITELPEEHCLSLFRRYAFSGRSLEECRQLEAISREIVSKCKRLPLAVKAMGCLLRGKRKIDEWERILHSEMWKLDEFERDVSTPLLVSYYNLPSMVKRCFTYCSMFPKGIIFNKDELIKLWMAQGYLGLDHNEELEIIGEECFNCLAMRSFFQEFEKDDGGSIIWYKMHDRVHDVAQYLSKNECCMIEVQDDFREESMNALCEKARHLRLMVEGSDTFPISICNFKKLRSLLIEFGDVGFDFVELDDVGGDVELDDVGGDVEFDDVEFDDVGGDVGFDDVGFEEFDDVGGDVGFDDVGSKLIGNVIPKLFDELTCLKALGIGKVYIGHIPKEIGKLIHLRYLDLSNNKNLIELPKTLCELYNLQTLKLDRCSNLKELPQRIGKLINLRHLMNRDTDSLRYMPKGMERLTHLRTLNEFHLNSGDYGGKACSLEYFLNNFRHIESLWIQGLAKGIEENIAQLKNNKNIRDLGLGFSGLDSMNKDDEAILEAFQPPPNLQQLKINYYGGLTMSTLRRMTSLTNLRSLELRGCRKCLHMPPLGKLPSLETLFIGWMVSVREVRNEFLVVESGKASSSSSSIIYFPKLKTLQFVYIPEWEVWDFGNEDDTCTIMPSLRSLKVGVCSKLKGLPKQLLHQMAPLQHLEIYNCSILEEVYEKGKGDKWQDISHIPNIRISMF